MNIKKSLIAITSLILVLGSSIQSKAQAPGDIIEMEKIATFSISQIDSLLDGLGVPTVFVEAKYAVDYYKVLYYTPYRHADSLVQASGGLAVPVGSPCPLPLTVYGHGTNSEKNFSASRMNSQQWEVCMVFASTGGVVAAPDYLGLGYPDPKVQVHPYQHRFSQANTMVNALRSARLVCDSLSQDLNDQIFVFGYSQGGFSAAACVREIELNYPTEFTVTASAPMSGALDMKGAQVDLMALDSPYSVPGYLPFLVFGYQEFYQDIYTSTSEIFKSPYDTVLPPLFYGSSVGIGTINGYCDSIPREMVVDSVEANFFADSTHFLRTLLEENDVIEGWAPQSPMRLYYCTKDEQVNYVNSINAYDKWTAGGAPELSKIDLGEYGHGDCAPFAFLAGKLWFDTFMEGCAASVDDGRIEGEFVIRPNPARDNIQFTMTTETPFEGIIRMNDLTGRTVQTLYSGKVMPFTEMQFELRNMSSGLYLLEIRPSDESLLPSTKRIVIE